MQAPPSPRRGEIRVVIDTLLQDQRGSWDMHADGSYLQRGGDGKHTQQQLIERTDKRLRDATRLRRRKVSVAKRKTTR